MEDHYKNPILITLPMPIETDRLILRPPVLGDGVALHEAVEETWADLNRWMIWAQKKLTADECEANIRAAHADFILRKDMRIHGFEKDTGRLVVSSGVHRFDWAIRRFEIGYWVRQSAQGKGYATECGAALTRYAFEVMGARHVTIEHADGNDASRRVIEKLGFVKEGVLKGKLPDHVNGGVYDSHVYSVSNAGHLHSVNAQWGHHDDWQNWPKISDNSDHKDREARRCP